MNKIWINEFEERTKSNSNSTTKNNARFLLHFSKRLFDLVVSLLVIIFLLSWLLPILAVLIKLDSKGSVFFIQKRVGAQGKIFYCLKLRTMVKNALANVQQAGANDPRITRVGKFLRYTYLDELPQFINVLNGDMSIVGPRPHMLNDCFNFLKLVPDYHLRHMVKPGITGMAQVKGYRGKVSCFWDVTHRFKLDMFYIRKACFMLDMKIIFQTFMQLLFSLDKLLPKERSIEISGPVRSSTPASTARSKIRKVSPMYEQLVESERQSA
jgi:putative colanic acid biosysnthesis UDP-glucose lipid carrier transferase